MRAWRVEYAALFNVAPESMELLYPHQILAMDEQIAELQRKQRR